MTDPTKLTNRELDALIAEKVMGWVWRQWQPEPWSYPIPPECKKELGMRFLCDPSLSLSLTDPADDSLPVRPERHSWIPPQYSTDRNAAALVLERIGMLDLDSKCLQELCRITAHLSSPTQRDWFLVTATPRQLMEAALRAWEEGR